MQETRFLLFKQRSEGRFTYTLRPIGSDGRLPPDGFILSDSLEKMADYVSRTYSNGSDLRFINPNAGIRENYFKSFRIQIYRLGKNEMEAFKRASLDTRKRLNEEFCVQEEFTMATQTEIFDFVLLPSPKITPL